MIFFTYITKSNALIQFLELQNDLYKKSKIELAAEEGKGPNVTRFFLTHFYAFFSFEFFTYSVCPSLGYISFY